jgi:hypothetical protein
MCEKSNIPQLHAKVVKNVHMLVITWSVGAD